MVSLVAEISGKPLIWRGQARLFPCMGPAEGVYGEATWCSGLVLQGPLHSLDVGSWRLLELKAGMGLALRPPKAQACIASRSQLSAAKTILSLLDREGTYERETPPIRGGRCT